MNLMILLIFTLWTACSSESQNYRRDPYNRRDAYNRQKDTPRGNAVSAYDSQRRGTSSNSKFAGTGNQEEGRRNFYRRRYYRRRRPSYLSDPCYRRNARSRDGYHQPRDNEGRFLWDVSVHNYYPQTPVRPFYGGGGAFNDYDCGGYGSYDEPPLFGGGGGFGNFLALFTPGGPLNPRPGSGGYRPPRPPPLPAPIAGGDVDPGVNPQNPDDIFDPVYEDTPNRPLYDDQPRPPRPGELVGGVANTVNYVIQTLAGARPGRGLIREIGKEYSDLLFNS